jgi:O-acetyl-ADP-ribose deacetylase (regulator of RNase III)
MPFEIIRQDITRMSADAIVNTANPLPIIGSGTDTGIHLAAGPELLEARKKIGSIAVGEANLTPAFGLSARFVIHTVGPQWQGGMAGEEQLLRRCYRNSLELARKHGCESIAFPLISAGIYGFPKQQALSIAVSAINEWLTANGDALQVYLVLFE